MVYKSGQIFLPFCHNSCVYQTDRRTDGQTDRIVIARPRLHSMQTPNCDTTNLQLHEMVICDVRCSVLALVVINALLYYQLTALESTVATRLMFDSITAT